MQDVLRGQVAEPAVAMTGPVLNSPAAPPSPRKKRRRKRGGLAGLWDRNKKVITPIVTGLAALGTGGLAAPIALGAAARGLDREGKGGIGFDVGQGLRGAAEGAASGSLANVGAGAVNAARAASAGGASLPQAAWQGIRNAAGELVPNAGGMKGGVAPVPMGTTPPLAAPQGSWLDRLRDWGRDPRNLLQAAQGAAGAYAEQQRLNQARAALREFDVPALDRQALAERMFNRFDVASAPAYEASLRDATRYAAATGRLNSGSLRTEYGNLANLRAQQLDAQRAGFLDDALAQSIADAQWRASQRAAARQNIGDIYGQRASRGLTALGNLARQQGRGPVLLPTPTTVPAPKRIGGIVTPIPVGA